MSRPGLLRVHVVEVELRKCHPREGDVGVARGLIRALPGCVLTAAGAKGIEAVALSDVTPSRLIRAIAEWVCASAADGGIRLAGRDLYLGDEMRPTECDWLMAPSEVAARALYRELHPELTDLERSTRCPAWGLRFPTHPRRPASAVFIAPGHPAVRRQVKQWAGIRPSSAAAGPARRHAASSAAPQRMAM
jgi:hypothetical protein